jgi:RNA polymerase sigma-70 factor (ECF subfamily)
VSAKCPVACFDDFFPVFVRGGRVSTELELVSRAQDGDLAAFESLYRSHLGRIYGLCLRMVADPHRAEDLTQEAFIRAWEKLAQFRGESAFATWLHRLAVNVVLGDLRARGRWSSQQVEITDSPALEDTATAPRSTSGIDLERAIAELPPQARTVFVLFDVEGYRHGEIATMTGISEGTSKAHLHRARRLLRKALSK